MDVRFDRVGPRFHRSHERAHCIFGVLGLVAAVRDALW